MEGFLYYFETSRAKGLLDAIQRNSPPGSVLLADHINDFTLSSLQVGPLLRTSWPVTTIPCGLTSSPRLSGAEQKQVANKWLTSTFSSAMERPEDDVAALGQWAPHCVSRLVVPSHPFEHSLACAHLTGFKDVEVVTVGDEAANYGIWSLPVIPRAESKEVMRTYLFKATTK